ncbi:CPBP family intramembrane metalloprotease [Candidatus Bathyarchaeota archaeon]|nr:CPBP family intramembrane metalloprotease [Candidatus Bathyarchaeota archaeon]
MKQNKASPINYLWILLITITSTIVLVIISRFTLIAILQRLYILQNIPYSKTWEKAQFFVSETGTGQAIAATLDALLMLILVYSLITYVENTEFSFNEMGLDLRKNTLRSIAYGLVVGSGLFYMALLLGVFFNLQNPQQYSSGVQFWVNGAFVSYGVFNLMNSLWQEIVFRGYLQNRAVVSYGRYKGVLLISIVFVLIHGLVQTLTLVRFISGLILFIFIGLIFDVTGSLFFVTFMHGALNYLVLAYQIEWKGGEVILTYLFALFLMIFIQRHKQRTSFP